VAKFRLQRPHVIEYFPSRVSTVLDADAEIDSTDLAPDWLPSPAMEPLDDDARALQFRVLVALRRHAARSHTTDVPAFGHLSQWKDE
jgi:hypothetical protein